MHRKEHPPTFVRTSQLFLLVAGVVGAVAWPLATLGGLEGISLMGSMSSMLLVPIAYALFARSVDRSVDAITGQASGTHHWLALATIIPFAGAIIEIVLLHTLAKKTASIEGAQDRSGPVLALALVRAVVPWLLSPVIALVSLAITDSIVLYSAVYGSGALVGLALLGLATQFIIAPVLDDVGPSLKVDLGGAGAGGSAAVSSRAPGSAARFMNELQDPKARAHWRTPGQK